MDLNFSYRNQFTPWVRDALVHDVAYPGQRGVMRWAIMEAIDSVQHRPLKRGTRQFQELVTMEVTISVIDDAIDFMMGVKQK